MKQKLLLHSCCAPCSSSVIEKLSQVFDITIFYFNPNIYPKKEYDKRLEEQKNYLLKLKIPLIIGEYDSTKYNLLLKDYKNYAEKSERCFICYRMRLEETAKTAEKMGFDYFTTTLSVSPHKNANWINEIGKSLETQNTKFLESDFKKQNGYLRSLQLSKENNFYRQDYCGCEMSYNFKKNNENNKNIIKNK